MLHNFLYLLKQRTWMLFRPYSHLPTQPNPTLIQRYINEPLSHQHYNNNVLCSLQNNHRNDVVEEKWRARKSHCYKIYLRIQVVVLLLTVDLLHSLKNMVLLSMILFGVLFVWSNSLILLRRFFFPHLYFSVFLHFRKPW